MAFVICTKILYRCAQISGCCSVLLFCNLEVLSWNISPYPAILNCASSAFSLPRHSQGLYHKFNLDRFLPHPFQGIIRCSSHHSTPCVFYNSSFSWVYEKFNLIKCFQNIKLRIFLCVFAKSRRAPISCIMSVRPPVNMYERGCH